MPLSVAKYFLNPLAFALAPVALALVLGYSYTKRVTSITTAFLGLVQAITPAAVYIAVTGFLPSGPARGRRTARVGDRVGQCTASVTWRATVLGLFSIPVRWGVPALVRLVPVLHGTALVLLALFGLELHLTTAYFVALFAMAIVVAVTDRALARNPSQARVPFQRHFTLSALYFVGVALAVFVPFGPAWVP